MAVLQEIGSANGLGTVEVSDNIVVGRDDHCDVVIRSPAVSRMHARIEKDGNRYYLHDLNSRNGTSLNERRIYDREPLRNGDVIDFSNNRFTFLTQYSPDEESESGGEFRAGPTIVQAQQEQDSSIYREAVQSGDVVPFGAVSPQDVRSARVVAEVSMLPDVGVPIVTFEAARKLQSVLKLLRWLRRVTTLDEFFDGVVDAFFSEFPSTERITIAQTNDSGMELHILRAASRNRSDLNYVCIPLIRHAATSRHSVLYTDEWNLSSRRAPEFHDLSHRFLMCLPLLDNTQECRVTIQLETSRKDRAFQASDLECLAVLGHVLTASLQLLTNAESHEGILHHLHDNISLEMESGSFRPQRIVGDIVFRSYCPAGLPGHSGICDRSLTSDGRQIFTLITLHSPAADAHRTSRLFVEQFTNAVAEQPGAQQALQSTFENSAAGRTVHPGIASAAVVIVDPAARTAEFAFTGGHSLFHHRVSSQNSASADALEASPSEQLRPELTRLSAPDASGGTSPLLLGAGDSLVILNDAFLERHRSFSPSGLEDTLPQLLLQALANPLVFDRVLEDYLESTTSHSSQNAAVAFAMIHQLPDNAVVASDCVPKGLAVE